MFLPKTAVLNERIKRLDCRVQTRFRTSSPSVDLRYSEYGIRSVRKSRSEAAESVSGVNRGTSVTCFSLDSLLLMIAEREEAATPISAAPKTRLPQLKTSEWSVAGMVLRLLTYCSSDPELRESMGSSSSSPEAVDTDTPQLTWRKRMARVLHFCRSQGRCRNERHPH